MSSPYNNNPHGYHPHARSPITGGSTAISPLPDQQHQHQQQQLHPSPPSALAQREIAIFWDFENIPLPTSTSAAEASRAIVQAVSHYGRIVDRRLYFDMSAPTNKPYGGSSSSSTCWSTLDSSGFDLVNTPRRNNAKETLDKKLIADILTFAWDSAVRNSHCKPCVVLLTSDGDYSYTLNKLRDRGVLSVVMYGKDANVASILKASADIPLSFYDDVLRNMVVVPSTTSPSHNHDKNNSHLQANDDDGNNSNNNHGNDPARTLCEALWAEQKTESSWVSGATLGALFRTKTSNTPSNNMKEYYQKARDTALAKGWLQCGRRYKGKGPNYNNIVQETTAQRNAGLLSFEDWYFRVTEAGKLAFTNHSTSHHNSNSSGTTADGTDLDKTKTRLFLKNIPKSWTIQKLVDFLEAQYPVQVVRGYTFVNKYPGSFIFACIEVATDTQAKLLLDYSQNGQIRSTEGRILQVEYNTRSTDISVPPNFLYDKSEEFDKSKSLFVPETDAHVYCIAFVEFMQNHSLSKKDNGWIDAGFWNIMKREQSPLNGDKERIKQARLDAIQQGWIESGRRVKLTGLIEAVEGGRNVSRHYSEYYIRLTAKGQAEFGGKETLVSRTIGGTEPSDTTKNRNVFVRNIALGTDIRDLVRFLEKEYGLAIEKAKLESPKSWSVCVNAHIEFSNASDTLHMLHLVAEDGLLFRVRSLKGVLDLNVPKFDADGDPAFFYVRPSTIDTASSDASVASRISLTKETDQLSSTFPSCDTEDSDKVGDSAKSNNVSDHPALFCRVIYDMQPSAAGGEGDVQNWCATGTVADHFMKNICSQFPQQMRKECWKKTNHDVISQGLVELGRRVLKSASRKITLVPYFSSKHDGSLSIETYLRLTFKGAELAKKTTNLPAGKELTDGIGKKNAFVTNLPLSTNIQDLVQYLKTTHSVQIDNALLTSYSSFAAAAHVEFASHADLNIISRIALQESLIFGGRPIRVRPDKSIPEWSQCDGNDTRVLFRQTKPEPEAWDKVNQAESHSLEDEFLAKTSEVAEDMLLSGVSDKTDLLNTGKLDDQPPQMEVSSVGTSFVSTPTSFHDSEDKVSNNDNGDRSSSSNNNSNNHHENITLEEYDSSSSHTDDQTHQVDIIMRDTMALLDDEGGQFMESSP
jgi:hypothetical protein